MLDAADIVQIVMVLATLLTAALGYSKLRPEKAKLVAEQHLTGSEAAALITDKALALLEETESRLEKQIERQAAALMDCDEKFQNCQTYAKQLEIALEDTQNALTLAKQYATRVTRMAKDLRRQMEEAGIAPKPLDY
jgi:hypothetical protein